MILQRAPQSYSREDQDRLRTDLERVDQDNVKRGRDIEMGDGRVILTSPNGSRFALTVSNAGVVGTTAL